MVTRASVLVAAHDAQKAYGDIDPAFEVDITGLQRGDGLDAIAYTASREPGEDVGEYARTISGASVQGNYEVSFIPATLTIQPAQATVRVNDATKVYGDADPDFTATVDGLKNGETAEGIGLAFTLSRAIGQAVGDYAITATGSQNQGNYIISYEPGTLAIQKAPLLVSAANSGKVYGDADPDFVATVDGLKNGDSAAMVGYSLEREPGEDVGDYTLTVSGEADQGNYEVSYAPAIFTITPAGTLAVYVTDIEAEYSGQSHGMAAVPSVAMGTTVEYSVDGGKTWMQDFPTRTDAGTTEVQVRARNANYDEATARYSIVVTPKPVVVRADDAEKVFNQRDPEFAFTVEGLVEGEATDTIELEGIERDPGEDAGTYAITPAGSADQGNYAVSFEPGTFTIKRRAVTITGKDASKIYGQDDPAFGAIVDGLPLGVSTDELEFSVTRSELDNQNVGTYAVMPTGAAEQGNYTITYIAGSFIIERAQAVVGPDAQAKVYGDDDPKLTATVQGLLEGDSISYSLTRADGEQVGLYEITPTGEEAQGNYTVIYETAQLEIKPAPVVVKADAKVQRYGATSPALTATVTGLKRADAEDAIAFDLMREAGNDVGVYAITPSGEQDQGNYTVEFQEGSYTITPAAAIVRAVPAAKVYGDTDPSFNATVEGLLFADTLEYELVREAGEDAGTYAITPVGPMVQGNYTVSYAPADFSITKANLVITAQDSSSVYGDADAALFATVSGLRHGDTQGVLDYSVTRTPGTDVGVYAITPVLASEPVNYTVQLATGAYEITPASVQVVAQNQVKAYGAPDPALTATVEGLRNGDAESLLSFALSRDAGEDVGSYSVFAAGAASQGNYRVSYIPALLTITRSNTLAVAATSASALYDGTPIAAQLASASVVEGTTIEYRVGEGAWSTDVPTRTDVGITKVHARATNPNYEDAEVEYTLQVLPRAAVVAANPAAKTYGDADPAFTATVSGLVDGDALSFELARTDAGDETTGVHETIVPSGAAEQGNYTVTYLPAALTIGRAVATVSAVNAAKSYGDADPSFTATVSGMVNGDEDDAISFLLERTSGEAVGTYPIFAKGDAVQGNYEVHYEAGAFSIVPAGTLAVVGTAYRGTYDGAPHGDVAVASDGDGTTVEYSTDGGATWSQDAPTITDVGRVDVQVRATNPNYEQAIDAYTLEVLPKKVVVQAGSFLKSYGDPDPSLDASATGLLGDDEVAYAATRAAGEDVGVYAVTAEGDELQGNYQVVYESGMLRIAPRQATVTVQAAAKVYGAADPSFTAEVDGVLEGDSIDYALTRDAGEDVGEYEVAAVGAVEQGNYQVLFTPAKLSIQPAALTVTVEDAQKTYGAADPSFTASVTGLRAGDDASAISYTLTRAPGEDVGAYVITAAGAANQGNYTVAFQDGMLSVNPRMAVVTAGDAQKVYGEADPAFSAQVEGVLDGDTVEYGFAREPGENAGMYGIQPEGATLQGNYQVVYEPGTLSITRAAVTVSAEDSGKVYGSADPALTAMVSGLRAGDDASVLTYTLTREPGEGVGTYDITADGAAVQGNYEVEYAGGSFTIAPAGTLFVAAQGETAVYDGAVHRGSIQVNVGEGTTLEYSVDEGATWSDAAPERTDVGRTDVQVRAKNPNYDTATASYAIVIEPKAAIVRAADAQKTYGEDDPAFDVAVSGLLGDDALAYEIQRTPGQNIGDYTIGVYGDAIQGNYTVAYEPGTLRIIPKKVTVKTLDAAKTYGDDDPAFTAKVSGLVAGDDKDAISYTLLREPGEDVGSYAIAASGDDIQGNYQVAFEDSMLTISPATVVVRANDLAKVYGDADPAFSAAYDGLRLGDGMDAISVDFNRTPGEDVGEYAIEPSGAAEQGNYLVEYESGTLSIVAAGSLVVSAQDVEAVYDGAPHRAAAVASVVEGTVVEYSIDGGSTWRAGAPTLVEVGSLAVLVRATNPNYETAQATCTLRVLPRDVVVTPGDASKVYGDADPAFSAAVNGLIAGEPEALISYKLEREAGEDVGEYVLAATGDGLQDNYRVSYAQAAFNIAPAQLTVRADAAAKIYGDADPALTARVEGLKNGDAEDIVSFEIAREVGEDVGAYAITAAGDALQGNYQVEYEPATFVISRSGELALAVDDVAVEYDGLPHGSTAAVNVPGETVVEYSVDGGATWSKDAPMRTDAGTTQVRVRATNANYQAAEASYAIQVTPRSVTVRADDLTKAYGEPDPEFTATVEGLVAGDSPADISYSLARVPGEDVVSHGYPITPAGAREQGNYTVSFERGMLAIVPSSALSVQAADYTATYDGQAHALPAATASVEVGTTLEYRMGDAGAWSTELPTAAEAGVYPVQVRATNPNYQETQTSCLLTIIPKPIVVRAADASKVYGEPDPELSATVEGVVAGDSAEDIVFTLAREAGRDVGSYAIVASGAVGQGNYQVSYENGALAVEHAPIVVAAADASKDYHAADPAFTATVEGLVGADPASLITYSIARSAGEDVNVEGYAIVPQGQVEQGNYRVSYQGGTFTISPREVEVSSASAEKPYDGTPLVAPSAQVTSELGFLAGEEPDYTFSGAQTEVGSSENTFAIVAKDAGSKMGNYKVTLVPGTLTVTPAEEPEEPGEEPGENGSGALSVSKVIVNPQPEYTVGSQVVFLITVRNTGDAALRNVVVEDTLAKQGAKVEFAATGGGMADGQTVRFSEIEAGGSRVLTATYTATAADAGERIANGVVARADGDLEASDSTESSPVESAYTLIIHYRYDDGQPAATDYVASLFAGDSFDVASPQIQGYEPSYVRIVSGDSGMPARNVEITVVYTATASVAPVNPVVVEPGDPDDLGNPQEPESSSVPSSPTSSDSSGTSASSGGSRTSTATSTRTIGDSGTSNGSGASSATSGQPGVTPAASGSSATGGRTGTTPGANGTSGTNTTPEASGLIEGNVFQPIGVLTADANGNPQVETLEDEGVPLASAQEGIWSLLDLLATIVMALVAVLLALGLLKRRRDEEEEEEEESEAVEGGSRAASAEGGRAVDVAAVDTTAASSAAAVGVVNSGMEDLAVNRAEECKAEEEPDEEKASRHPVLRTLGILLAVAAVILLLVTQDFTLAMDWLDRWTPLFALMLVAQLVLAVLAKRKGKGEEDGSSQGEEEQADAAREGQPAAVGV